MSVSDPTDDAGPAPVRIALLGCGVVGAAVARLMVEHADDLATRWGRRWSSCASRCAARDGTGRPPRCPRSCSPPTPTSW